MDVNAPPLNGRQVGSVYASGGGRFLQQAQNTVALSDTYLRNPVRTRLPIDDIEHHPTAPLWMPVRRPVTATGLPGSQ
jgi:hypothetical protein